MSVRHRIVANTYKDSVALMAISSKLLALDGVDAASVVMATPTNLENLVAAGLSAGLSAGPDDAAMAAKPSDLVVAVRGTDEACDAALALAAELLARRPVDAAAADRSEPPPSLRAALVEDPASSFALVSVPGPYAAAEALKALRLGLNVMVFSDNVAVAQEVAIKREAQARGLMVMGPDCGTAIVNGLPLGFANVVRRGPIGVVGASGTGMQEVTSRIHQLGSGVSQALGTGGHDLSAEVGGISMLTGLRALDADPSTEVIVLVSKPPAPAVAAAVLDAARALGTPVVAVFLGADPAGFAGGNVHGATTLAEAADAAVALAARAGAPRIAAAATDEAPSVGAAGAGAPFAPGQRFVRGVFCGGTFCYEAQLLARAAGIDVWSNTPVAGNPALADPHASRDHTMVDMGDDAYTQGRPHPMIDPSLRDERVERECADPGTAVVLVDVVLGYGSAADPVSGLLGALERGRADAAHHGRHVAVVAHVCGTDADPQDRAGVIARLRAANVTVAPSNADAARGAVGLALALDPGAS